MILTDKIRRLLDLLSERDAQIKQLSQELEITKKHLNETTAENVELHKKYNNLKIAKGTLTLSKGDISEAKKQITDIISQVDVCIAKLSDN